MPARSLSICSLAAKAHQTATPHPPGLSNSAVTGSTTESAYSMRSRSVVSAGPPSPGGRSTPRRMDASSRLYAFTDCKQRHTQVQQLQGLSSPVPHREALRRTRCLNEATGATKPNPTLRSGRGKPASTSARSWSSGKLNRRSGRARPKLSTALFTAPCSTRQAACERPTLRGRAGG